ncbi:hypothetical protein ACFYSC_30600 [Streptosporangium sp. NPDC004379]|uniref:hypothetical protein n=1 Tax=Streptosporangium sp. NPDC004379 TaxID=3366189 RepID=UPI0036CBF0ED
MLAAVLARRGIDRVVATDISPRALACAHENVRRLRLTGRIDIVGPALFPDGRAVDRIDTGPRHPRARDTTDPLHAARAAEVTSLWRLTGG